MAGIFISYRREDSIAHAGRLYDRLISHFGRERVFMDVDTIDFGVDFVDSIQRTVASCDVLLAVIGRHWLDAKDEEGRHRLESLEDFVRVEITAALERGVRVIPILVGGARMPRSTDLPDAMATLARRNALDLPDLHFSQGVNRLIESLQRILSQAEQERLVEERKAQAEAEQQRLAEEKKARAEAEEKKERAEAERQRLAEEKKAQVQAEQQRLAEEKKARVEACQRRNNTTAVSPGL